MARVAARGPLRLLPIEIHPKKIDQHLFFIMGFLNTVRCEVRALSHGFV